MIANILTPTVSRYPTAGACGARVALRQLLSILVKRSLKITGGGGQAPATAHIVRAGAIR